jgi:misacylated tRNA(Ala) deacylase
MEKAKLLFQSDSYLRQTQSKITAIKENIIFFENTIFYAQGGGQPGDTGEIQSQTGEKFRIINTTYDEQRNVCHHLEKNITSTKGDFLLKIDWERRYKLMKMHSCMHVICSLIDADITGCAVGEEKSRIDFNLKNGAVDKEMLSANINKLIQKGAPIVYQWWEKADLDKQAELVRTIKVSPPLTGGKYRIVEIEGIDIQPCGGTHVKNIREIGEIAITKIKNKGENNRRIYIEFV